MFKFCIGTPVTLGGSDDIGEVVEQHTLNSGPHYRVIMPSGSNCIYSESELTLPPKDKWPVSFPWKPPSPRARRACEKHRNAGLCHCPPESDTGPGEGVPPIRLDLNEARAALRSRSFSETAKQALAASTQLLDQGQEISWLNRELDRERAKNKKRGL